MLTGTSYEKALAMTKDQGTIIATGGQAWVRRFEGVVMHVDRRQELHVSSSGGGGLVGAHGGYVEASTISSSSIDHQTVFLRDDRGREEAFDLENWHVPARPGNRLAVLWGSRVGQDRGAFLAVANFDTGDERWEDVQTWARGQRLLAGRMLLWPSGLIAFVLGLAFMTFASYAQTRTLTGAPEYGSRLALATFLAFMPTIVIEWFVMIAMRLGDTEHKRIKGTLSEYLRSGRID